jgi:hypothetical protein
MANPMSNEHLVYEKIKSENSVIPPFIWDLINHHINNDLYMINLIIGTTVLDGEPLSEKDGQKVIDHVNAIKDFLIKLEEATRQK